MSIRLLFILLLWLLAEVYSYMLIRNTTRSLPTPWRQLFFWLYISLTTLTLLSLIFFRKIDWAGIPHSVKNVFVAFTMGFLLAKILVFAILLIDDLRRGTLWLWDKIFPTSSLYMHPSKGMTRSEFFKSIALILGGTSIGGFLYGLSNRYNYKLRKITLHFPQLPDVFRGMKIVQISDIHAGSFDRIEAVAAGIDLIEQQNPDMIVVTGDLVNNRSDEMRPFQNLFARLTAPLGTYSILGNHDYGDYEKWPSAEAKRNNLEELKNIQAEMGWRLLMNEHVILEKSGKKLALIGVENWSSRAHFPRYGDIKKACSGIEPDVPFRILLSHDPSHFNAQVLPNHKDIDLTLSGHTHGMQFGVEIPGFKWSPIQYMYKRWAGLYQEGHQYLYVNRGFGFLGYAGRIGILPEITVIELT